MPTRRFGDEWLALDVERGSVLVVRGAAAIAAAEMLARPRDVGALVACAEASAGGVLAERLATLFGEMRDGRMLTEAHDPIALDPLLRFATGSIEFFTSTLGSLFGGVSAPSCVKGPGGGIGNCSC